MNHLIFASDKFSDYVFISQNKTTENPESQPDPQQQPHQHKYGAWQKNDEKTHKKICEGCGDIITEEHKWDSGKITLNPAPGKDGIKTYTCTECGYEKNEIIPKLPEEETAE